MASVKASTLTYTVGNIEHTVCLAHIVEVLYDDLNKNILLSMTNGDVITLSTLDEVLYENICKALVKYYNVN